MVNTQDVERGEEYQPYNVDAEREALLPSPSDIVDQPVSKQNRNPNLGPVSTFLRYAFTFCGGVLACLIVQYAICGPSCLSSSSTTHEALAPPYVGSTDRHHFPPPSPTNAIPSLFPTSVGYAGGTPTGAEPALLITAPSYPVHTGAAQLVVPPNIHTKGNVSYDLFRKWGNLSPWYSVDRTAFGMDSGPEPPETCRVTALHFLHRHGARYPTGGCKYRAPTLYRQH
jgi:hypothetical protein